MKQLDKGIDTLLTGVDGEGRAGDPAVDPTVVELLMLAARLRTAPRPDFKARLKSDLLASTVSSVEIISGTHPIVRTETVTVRGRVADTPLVADILPGDILLTRAGSGYGMYPVQRSSFMASLGAHALMAALLVTAAIWAAPSVHDRPGVTSTVVTDLSSYVFPSAPDRSGGGGGGGDSDPLRATKGAPPRFARDQVTPPAIVVRSEQPKLSAAPTVVGPPALSFPQNAQIGDPFSNLSGVPSNGTGSRAGIGSGDRGGVGPGTGPGVGDGWGGGVGGGPYMVGGAVRAPRLIYDPEPEYSDEARKQKYQGAVVLRVVVGEDGRPRDIRVAQSLGLGLDEKALEAVRGWRFEPGRLDGRAVAVVVNVQVNFRLY